ncbi:MAG: HAMP domain-containing protein [Gemmatimonadetes bacterium]|nr:HAMP domain-containing protein [Gemmatimonadota bacterium]
MQSIRRRLSLSYALALTTTLGVFGAALYLDRRSAAAREREERVETRLKVEANFAVSWLEQQSRIYPRLVRGMRRIGSTNPADSTWDLLPEIRGYFQGLGQDYLFVADPSGRLLFVSQSANDLEPASLSAVRDILIRTPVMLRSGRLRLTPDGEPFRYYMLPTDSVREVRAVLLAARPDDSTGYGPNELLMAMLIVAPLILVASIVLGYWLAGRALQPMDTMVEELVAMRDGRSLHRRIAVPPGQDELSRLAQNLNAMLDRVEQSFVALRRFTADASHELKTPLMVLRAGVERSLTDPRTPAELVASLDETLRQINQMSDLVTNLLTLARADEGRSSLVLRPADLRGLVAEAGETAEILGEQQRVTVVLDLPEVAVEVPVDPPRMRQLLMNLVTNAVKYTPAGGTVTLTLRDQPEAAILSVQDTGIGIAPGDLEHVFDRFWRADPARSRTGDRPGTGLGLAIVKWVAEAHGGSIQVQSRPGRGSTFVVTIPKLEPKVPSPVPEGDR